MRACLVCHHVKWWWQFPTTTWGYYTRITDVCRRCACSLMWRAIDKVEQQAAYYAAKDAAALRTEQEPTP